MIPNQYHCYHHKCPPASLPAASKDDVFGDAQVHLAIGQIADANIVDVSTAGTACRSMGPAMSFPFVRPSCPARTTVACGG